MKSFKFISTITNKIGNLTNRNNTSSNSNLSKGNITYDKEQDISKNIDKMKSILESIKLQNNFDKNNPYHKKTIEKLEKYLDRIMKAFFDMNIFNQNSFQYLIETKLIPTLTENINVLSVNTISSIIMPYLQKIIFIDQGILSKGNIKEEIIIMNTQVVGCIKKIIFEFKNILSKVNIISVNSELFIFINKGLLPFMNELFSKLIKYPNFYHSLVNDSTTININIELLLFDILINLLKFEHQIKDRTSRTLIRKNLLRFINNFEFPNKKESMEKVINYLISNLIDYYQNFLLLSIKKIDNNYKIFNNFPLEIDENDVIQITTDDTISYLQFFNILSFSFSQYNLKDYLLDLLFNNFFCQYILEEIINLSNDISYQARSTLLIEYIFFISKYIKNYDISELFFYFLFGYNLEDKKLMEDELNLNNNTKYRKMISKSNHNYESIRAFFTLIIESNNINQFSLLIKTLTNLSKNIPYIFMSEMVVPYYLFYLNKKKTSEKDFDDTIDNLMKKPEQLGLLEIVKILMPQYFTIDPVNWLNYFIKNIEINYERGVSNINRMNISSTQDFYNDSSLMNKSGENNSSNISYGYKNMINISNYSFSDYNNESILSSRGDLNESLFGNQTKDAENEVINISIENRFSYILNSISYASRVKFFEILVKKYKKYVENQYEENLYLTDFFNEISSIPTPLDKGTEGQQLYNVYAGITYAKKNNEKFFDISAAGILHTIKNQLDKKVTNNFTKEEITNFCILMNDQDNSDLFLMTNDLNSDLAQKIEFLKNIKLYNEVFKDYVSNIFAKILTEESNHYWIKGIKQNSKNNGEL